MYAVAVAGAGPAGVAAAVFAARQGVRVALVGEALGGARERALSAWQAPEEAGIGHRLRLEAGREKIACFLGSPVTRVEREAGWFSVHTARGDLLETRALVVATGRAWRGAGVEGERRFQGLGVAYLPLRRAGSVRGKRVAVAGGDDEAVAAALALASHGARVTVLAESEAALTARDVLVEKAAAHPAIAFLVPARAVRVTGHAFVEHLEAETGEGRETLAVDRVLLEARAVPATGFIDFVEKDHEGAVVVDALQRASVDGVFAAGDCTPGFPAHPLIAAGEGARAGLAAARHALCTAPIP